MGLLGLWGPVGHSESSPMQASRVQHGVACQGFRMNLMGRVTIVETAKTVLVGRAFGVNFYVDGSQSEAMTADYMFPGWLVPRAVDTDKATCELQFTEVAVKVPGFPSASNVTLKLPYLKPASPTSSRAGPLTRPWFDGEAKAKLQSTGTVGAKLAQQSIKMKTLADALVVRGLKAQVPGALKFQITIMF